MIVQTCISIESSIPLFHIAFLILSSILPHVSLHLFHMYRLQLSSSSSCIPFHLIFLFVSSLMLYFQYPSSSLLCYESLPHFYHCSSHITL